MRAANTLVKVAALLKSERGAGAAFNETIMDSVFIYWDNSNIFIGAQYVAMEREGQSARSRVRVH